MRALQFRAFGDPVAQLALVNLLEPQQSDGWAIVRVHAASVNPSDVKDVAGLMEGAVLPLTTRRSPVRSMCTRKSTRTFRSTDCIGFSTMPRRSPTPTSPASPRSAAGSRFSIAWPTRANILSSAMGGAPPLRRRRSARCWRWASKPVPARTRRRRHQRFARGRPGCRRRVDPRLRHRLALSAQRAILHPGDRGLPALEDPGARRRSLSSR